MNTKRIYIIYLMLSVWAFSACNDEFMDRYPLDKIGDETFFLTTNDLKTYANQFYPNLNALGGYSNDNQSDNQGPSTKHAFLWNEYTIPASGGGWGKSDWLTIRRCNYFLQRYHTAKGENNQIRLYVGEVLFFKSLAYYDKVVQFGDVPWLNSDLHTNSTELYAPRSARKLVIDSVCANLDKAISYLPEETTDGRITRYAALALKSRVCLFEGTYRKYHGLGDETRLLQQAASAAWEVINSGKFGLYDTGNPSTDYHSFFQLRDMKGVKEAIHYVQYEMDLRTHNRIRECRESGTGMTKDFVTSYLCTDGLPIALSANYKGDMSYDDEFENRDARMKQTIYTSERPIFITTDGKFEFESTPIFSNTSVYTGYRIYKMYSPLAADNEFEKCTIDDCVFRYAEVLLNYAEAKAELGECDQTVIDQTVNLLRDRVAMSNMQLPVAFTDPDWPDWEVPVSPLLNEIRRERRVELACEGFRFNDLRRWKAGKLLNNPKTYSGARDPETGNYRVLYLNMTRTWNDKLYLYPLPTDEMVLNPNLKPQNPGWE